jgi:hypothetical protein
MGDVFVDTLPVWLVDASNLEFVHGGKSLQVRVEVNKSLFFADPFEGGAVSFLVHEATGAHIAFHKPLVSRIENLRSLFHRAITVSVAFGWISSHNIFGLDCMGLMCADQIIMSGSGTQKDAIILIVSTIHFGYIVRINHD